ncbi:uncharacterized protein LOC129591631 isoform X2 [Paramacrobiotus metropolitanus]|uniref:uncharacterized protein LOC129591631 isoform X2 n=1 Tax=Paramacrobiotus metropolitanus TaxID=2943436 RepID=UPI0024459C2E|nr:uncharacterized protein LOC129591631 isoform X2 [Paramacrobiotus metropolitanus]XP_055343339.1 uncharacterized protein LOC129591631 isoform X2 [Paramacrobiotus metropolitanus]XP_055343340.1 uncharacterized protein LOC129591631 isoform X2 [Paramacrobiotus metropolitanus]
MVPLKLAESDASKVWCLGFIEDISVAADEMYINFHCTTLGPLWFPSHTVFSHAVCPYYPPDKLVLVALRTSVADPLVFEEALILAGYPATPRLHSEGRVYYVHTTGDGRRHLVHELQIAKQRPQRSLAGACVREGCYAKYCLTLPAVITVEGGVTRGGGDGVSSGCSIDENRVAYELQRSRHDLQCRNHKQTMASGYGNRFYFHVQNNAAVRIICWEQGDGFWTAELLAHAVQRCLKSGALLLAATSAPVTNPVIQRPQCFDQEPTAGMSCLPLEIIAQVVELTDVITQTRLKRVSPAWNAVLAGATQERLLVDFSMRVDSVDCSSEMLRLGQLLHNTLTTRVRTLVLTQWTPGLRVHGKGWSSVRNDLAIVCGLLRITSTAPLRRIVLHRCIVDYELGAYVGRKLRSLALPMEVCRHLLLVDYTMNNALQPFSHVPFFCSPLDRSQRRQAQPALSITLPFLRLDTAQSSLSYYNTLLVAVVQRLPAPSPDILRTVTALYTYWYAVAPEVHGRYWNFLRRLLHLTEPVDPSHPDSSPWAVEPFTPTTLLGFNALTLVTLSSLWYMDADA